MKKQARILLRTQIGSRLLEPNTVINADEKIINSLLPGGRVSIDQSEIDAALAESGNSIIEL
jgi:hypothetical protein